MSDQVLTRDGPVAVPLNYTVPQSGELVPLMVTASLDGTSAASAFYAAVQVIAPSGRVMGTAISVSIAAGASASVTWFPGGGRAISAANVAFVGARIENHAGQSIVSGTQTDLTYDTVAFDTGGMANLGANSRILTVQQAGLYLVQSSTIWQYNNAGRRLNAIFQNSYYSGGGAAVAADSRMPVWAPVGGIGGGAPHSDNISVALLQAVAGDFFSSGVLQVSGAAVIANGLSSGSNQDNFLSAILLGTG